MPSSRANAEAPHTNVHHGSISSASEAGTANTHSSTRPQAAGAAPATARVSTRIATTPRVTTIRQRSAMLAGTGGTPVRTSSNDWLSRDSRSSRASGPGPNSRIPLLLNTATARHSSASNWPTATSGVGSRSARSPRPALTTTVTARAT